MDKGIQNKGNTISGSSTRNEVSLPHQYKDFADVFTKESFDALPEHKAWDHAIDLKDRANTNIDGKTYPLNPKEQKELDSFLKENLESGHIRPSKSPIASLMFFVKKKDRTLRPVQDYRRINEITIKNKYPLPLITDIIRRLQGATIFTKFDIRWGYNNIQIKEGDK